ncbi:unnamed protein product, partial [Tilletia controversa]
MTIRASRTESKEARKSSRFAATDGDGNTFYGEAIHFFFFEDENGHANAEDDVPVAHAFVILRVIGNVLSADADLAMTDVAVGLLV